MSLIGLAWVILGGFLEPVWVIGLKKYSEKHSLFWIVFTVVFMYLSPMTIAFAMQDGMSLGMSYSIWTGLGAVFSVIVGYILFKDKLDRLKVLFIAMVIAGVVGLEMSTVIG
ncbi:MAG: QacE family quaternary ammonium compound efflux SMR transporter [Candidatus Methanomethylophilaceae archaeon]|jgi:quaternary ammonium compound-resistance protein SugE|nr:QacE family quaternary ammonium compound efflux SMR transporter [Candidatus Methanomethylophilaceae archaeon]MBP5734855.1 QacE family quaternary ammonium compound efflux SMR transporter [Candidatus Methanomethylophilaceae archaeon]